MQQDSRLILCHVFVVSMALRKISLFIDLIYYGSILLRTTGDDQLFFPLVMYIISYHMVTTELVNKCSSNLIIKCAQHFHHSDDRMPGIETMC
jgi:hypothetical protein